MIKQDRIQLPFLFESLLLQSEVENLLEVEWINHFVTQNYQGNWSVIPLTAQEGVTHPIQMAAAIPGDYKFVPTQFLALCPYIQSVLECFKTEKSSVRLMKLTPGSEIKEHRDFDLDEGEVRIHIPVFTNEGVSFFVNYTKVNMKEGECWYLRLSDPHRVLNEGNTDRIHLVMDLKVNEWLNTMLL
ncbi:aspartyl/asparaginyl beta-hydroxylase domain-containing protein [Algoriphagus sp. C2-6-M1]|uniref:aspartyl/asparaginyl beta-hydroxylase domain-containing protein n=1 Tax=Algoriphagus persicinus TaxID=3108754 RepID=UPI002B3C775F|nr:aspartyl/asparaginyl beta-hydroxylase domain-containing protein [Algoriphagus sp. C2-6-M1]MEB2781973.1 aspartyl/asparaginyl beta-hydroxylase domain-containing protein [Algoriphagus sp. C2-6-M1]